MLGCAQRRLRPAVERHLNGRAELVERDSGGGAVWSGPWLVSASVVLPPDHPWARASLLDAYRRLGHAHVEALDEVGVVARSLPPAELPRAPDSSAIDGVGWACFGGLSPWELVDAGGRKLVGLAQRRRRSGVLLVAGTLIGPVDWSMLCAAMGRPQRVSMLAQRTVCAAQIAGTAIDPERFAGVLTRNLSHAVSRA